MSKNQEYWDRYYLKRVFVEPGPGSRGRTGAFYELFVGQSNMNTRAHEGNLADCLAIKAAFLATGEYTDTSAPEFGGVPLEGVPEAPAKKAGDWQSQQ